MKIAMIGHKVIPSRSGGIEVAVGELSKRIFLSGNEIHAYNRYVPYSRRKIREEATDSKKKEYEGIRLIWIPTFERSSLNAFVYSVLASVRALFGHYDVVHIHAEGPAVMAWLFHLFQIPVVVTIHGLDWQRAKWGKLAKKYLLFGETCAVKYADELIVLTESARRYFFDTYQRKTICIRNGIGESVIKKPDQINKKWNLEKNQYILYLARIVPEKGLHYLLEAYRKIETDQRLVVAGAVDRGNSYMQKILQMARADSRVIFTGFVNGTVVNELYSNCSLFILPSDVEGMPLSLLEALSFGCRCVVSDIPEHIETAGAYAAYFKKGDMESLRFVLEQELDSDRTCETEEQIMFAKANYSWEQMAQETMGVYEELINENYNGK